MSAEAIKTQMVEYPCPACGKYHLPFMISKDGYAYMLCTKCKSQYRTSTAVSANFRIFCQKVGSAPNRSASYYTSSEKEVKKLLEDLGLREGIDFIHNCRVKNYDTGTYYWIDFYLPHFRAYISMSPSIWHRMWGRHKSDVQKLKYLTKAGLYPIIVNEKNYKEVILTELTKLGYMKAEGRI